MTAILVVDDSLTVRMDLAEALAEAGFEVAPCATLGEARAVLQAQPIGLAILDVVLPDGDGIGFLDELRSDPRHAELPILVLSSEAEVRDRVRGLKTGANDYLGKPYDTASVIERVRELVGAGTAVREVLVVDDSPTFRHALAGRLERAGYTVVIAASGAEALRLAAGRRPSAIIVDGVMPEMDGPAVIRRVRLDPVLRTIPCLLLTGSDDAIAEIHALDDGADAFARKNADADVILAKLAAMMRTSELPAGVPAMPHAAKRILVVDGGALRAVAEHLREQGFDVVRTATGPEAIDLLAVQPVDCILLDAEIATALDTSRRIKSAPVIRDTPLIVVAADDTREATLAALTSGADDFVPRAIGRDVLVARVESQIRRKKMADEHRRIRDRLMRSEQEAAEERAARQVAEARAELAAQLERSNAELAEANRELEAFSYTVSHDLRAPLRAISGFSRALDEDCGDRLDERGREHVRRIVAATARMSDLIDALLELSRIARAQIVHQRVDVSALALAVIDELRRRDPGRAVDVAVAPGLVANADPRLLRVVLDNLLGNAWKFTSQRSPGRIDVGRDPRGFYVRDNGAGFDMSRVDRLFAPFQRLHTEAEFRGTGIGLSTVRRIIERHRGQIGAESALGAGATFWFALP